MDDGAAPAGPVMEHRLGNILRGNSDLLTPLHVGDAAFIHRIRHRALDVPPVTLEKPLPVDGILVLGVESTVDDVTHASPCTLPLCCADDGYCDFLTLRNHSASSRTCFSV